MSEPIRYLRAEQLARLAGLGKSTILAAIRRGEIVSSRTLGRGTRIPIDVAREFLVRRGCEVPVELQDGRVSSAVVVTCDAAFARMAHELLDASWTVQAPALPYAALLWIGAHDPALVVVDLDRPTSSALQSVRCLAMAMHERTDGPLRRLVAVGSDPAVRAAAAALGADVVVEREFAPAVLAAQLVVRPPPPAGTAVTRRTSDSDAATRESTL